VTVQPAPGFAGLLRQLRAEAGLTQEELAEAARLSPRTVSDLERGIHRAAHQDTARLLADALGLVEPARTLFVAAARGQVPADQVLAARADAPEAVDATGAATRQALAVPVPRELPADVGAFTGRAVELAELDFLLPAGAEQDATIGPMVVSVLAGTAGVGKTALAVHWAHRAAGQFPDGQLYVNLRGYDPGQPVTPSQALAGFLRALGVADADIPLHEADRATRYRSLLSGRRVLVVLDNAATAGQVRPLLPGTGTAMVLVTSRDSLAGLIAIDGAHRLDLDLLSPDEAVALLRTLIGSRAAADPAAAQTLAHLCALLPLALRVAAELAVAQPEVPLADLVTQLTDEADRLALLQAGDDPRGAVGTVFSWSCQHLPAAAVQMFRLLSLHPAQDWDYYAAATLTATASLTQARQTLAELARAHLIRSAAPGRYQMHDLLRAYAAGLATSHDGEQARQAALTGLFDYYLAASAAAMDRLAPAEHHQRPEPPPPPGTPVPEFGDRAAARAWLDAELATLTAVAAHTASHGWPGHTTRLAATLFRYLYGSHDTEALTVHAHGLDAANRLGDRVAQAHMLANLGYSHDRQGRYQQATACFEQALALARDTGDRFAQARALAGLAIVRERQGRFQEAIDCYQQALVLFRELGSQPGEVRQLGNLSGAYLRQGQYERAMDHARQVLVLAREIDDQDWVARSLCVLGEICCRMGRYVEADDYARHAVALAHETGHKVAEAQALTGLGEICHRRGDHDHAANCHQEALALYRELGDPIGEADALNGTGETLLAAGQPDQARACHTTALTLARQIGHRHQQARALTGLGQVSHGQGQHEQAESYYQQALALYQEIGDPSGQAEALNSMGQTSLATGHPDQACACHTTALALAQQIGDRYQQASAHYGLAVAYQGAGDIIQAERHRQQALEIYTDLGVPEASRAHTWSLRSAIHLGGDGGSPEPGERIPAGVGCSADAEAGALG
jgi:tetratricopeptide (TPR) repeat protein/transcriptional regulator with XRE-family HTH domain